MLSDAQREQIQDIARLIPEDERQAFLGMLSHELRGRELLSLTQIPRFSAAC
jgi:hypothetical protein